MADGNTVIDGDDEVDALLVANDLSNNVAEVLEQPNLLVSLEDGVIIQDLQGCIVEVTPAACRLLGIERDRLLGSSISDLAFDLVDSTRAEWAEGALPWTQVISTGHEVRDVVMGINPDSEERRWLLTACRPVEDGGVIAGVRTSIVDVTEVHACSLEVAASARHAELLAEHATDIVVDVGLDNRIRWISRAVEGILGRSPEALLGAAVTALVEPIDLSDLEHQCERSRAGESTPETRYRFQSTDGLETWLAVRTTPVLGRGEVGSMVMSARVCTEEVHARQALEASEERYRLLVENESEVVARADLDGTIEWISPSIVRMAGWRADQVEGRRLAEFVVSNDQAKLALASSRLVSGSPVGFKVRMRTAGGAFRWVSGRSRPLINAGGGITHQVMSIRDVHDEVIVQERLQESEERFRLAMESAPVGIALLDLDRRFIAVNPCLCEMLGREESWMLDHRIPEVLDPDDDMLDLRTRASLLSGHSAETPSERRLVRPDGTRIWVECSSGLLHDAHGDPTSYVSIFVDVSETKATREKLSYQATHDMLTHLLNRQDLFDQARTLLQTNQRSGTSVGVLYLDIDDLKLINDTYGHAAGDHALIGLAERLTDACRTDDIISRIGGDEFVILLPGLHAVVDAERVAAKITNSLQAPLRIDGHHAHVTVSIGIVLADPDEDAEFALRNADHALYRAKVAGRGLAMTYDSNLD